MTRPEGPLGVGKLADSRHSYEQTFDWLGFCGEGDVELCGIAGAVSASEGRSGEALVLDMLEPISHRGPDGWGCLTSGNVTLGHRRLAILDLSDAGAQPMVRGAAILTYNGEIYNYIELRKELLDRGHRFSTSSDSEVLLEAYLEWGTDCVQHFEGMWAFAIYDSGSSTLFCSRDRFGEKPFLYIVNTEGFFFGSEPNQFLKTGLLRQADMASVLDYIGVGQLASVESTFLQGLRSLPPASNLVLDVRSLEYRIERYYVPGQRKEFQDLAPGDIALQFGNEVRRAVDRRLRSDVPVGLLLSGGIDSSLIATIAGPSYLDAGGSKLVALTALSGDPANDERRFAAEVAKSAGLSWVPVQVHDVATREFWPEATAIAQQPLASSSLVMQMQVMRKAQEVGLKVLLDGQGADETWLGYPRHVVLAMRGARPGRRPSLALANADKSGLGFTRWLLHWIYFRFGWVTAMRSAYQLRGAGLELSRTEWGRLARRFRQQGAGGISHQADEVHGEQLGALLRYADRNSMAHSIEDRLPFLDSRLVDLAFATPIDVKFRDGWSKWLLRQLLSQSVPSEIAWRRRKVGFAPSRSSFDPSEKSVKLLVGRSELLREIGISRVKLDEIHEGVAWRIYSVALWEQIFGIEPGSRSPLESGASATHSS